MVQVTRAIDFCCQGRGDADQPDRFTGLGKSLGQGQDFWLDRATDAFDGKVGEVFRRAKATGYDQRIEIVDVGLTQILHVAPGDPRGLHQHVAALGHFLARQVIDHMQLGNVGGEALDLRPALIEAQQGDHAFVDLGAVIHATAGKDHCNFFAHGLFLQIHGVKCLLICHSLP
jgi:hypothetical protein